jgi:hypothetical protein
MPIGSHQEGAGRFLLQAGRCVLATQVRAVPLAAAVVGFREDVQGLTQDDCFASGARLRLAGPLKPGVDGQPEKGVGVGDPAAMVQADTVHVIEGEVEVLHGSAQACREDEEIMLVTVPHKKRPAAAAGQQAARFGTADPTHKSHA